MACPIVFSWIQGQPVVQGGERHAFTTQLSMKVVVVFDYDISYSTVVCGVSLGFALLGH